MASLFELQLKLDHFHELSPSNAAWKVDNCKVNSIICQTALYMPMDILLRMLDGVGPQMPDVHFANIEKGNTLTVMVQFSAPVVLNEASPPNLGSIAGANVHWTTYSTGSGSSTLSFLYQVVVGDSSAMLEFQ